MKALFKYLLIASSLAILSLTASASEEGKSDKDWSKGYVTGSFESKTNIYQADPLSEATVPEGRFGSNNYLKLDYYNNRISAGIQLEAYAPVLVGLPTNLEGAALTGYYINWTDDNFSLTAGTIYDQFGSGLLFRTWEDRAIGHNNALTGARISWRYKDILEVKALWGMPRYGMKFSETSVKGADLSFALSNLAGWKDTYLALEASVLDRYEELSPRRVTAGCIPYSTGWSARANLESQGFFFKAEYVDGGQKYYRNQSYTSGSGNLEFLGKRGNAQLIETGYNRRGLGVNVNLRRLEWMQTSILNDGETNVNMLNYIPALCTQYTYMLTTIKPYGARCGDFLHNGFVNSGELGGQIDVFYNFRRGSVLGGKRGMRVHGNISTYYTIAKEGTFSAGRMLFRDLSLDIEKQWNKKFKSTILWSMQEISPDYGANRNTYLSNIFVADLLYKHTDTFSTRLELQYLICHEYMKDWMAALLEVSFAPHWSIYASDMYNHGSSKIHYYNGGVSYVKSRTRLALGYGRFREGLICSGGVCVPMPAHTGANLSLTMSF